MPLPGRPVNHPRRVGQGRLRTFVSSSGLRRTAAATLVALAFGAVSGIANSASAAGVLDAQRSYVLGDMNRERAAAGLPPLVASATLTAAANEYAQFLSDHDRLGHEADGRTPSARAGAAGWPADAQGVGEIVGGSDAANRTKTWDEPHRVLFMDPGGMYAGVGTDRGHGMWVIDLASWCPTGREAECALTGETGNTSIDIFRVMAQDANDPLWWAIYCPDILDPKPSQCRPKDESIGPDGTRKAAGVAMTVRAAGRRVNVRVTTSSIGLRGAPKVTLQAKGQRTRTARLAGTGATNGPTMTTPFRATVPRGRWTVRAVVRGQGGFRTSTMTRVVRVR